MKRKHFILALVAMLWSFSFSAYADDVIVVNSWAELKAALEANDGVQRSAARQRSTAMRTTSTASGKTLIPNTPYYYEDFQTTKIQLGNDVVYDDALPIAKSNGTTLDLNGHKVLGSESAEHAYPFYNYGKFLVVDNSEAGTGAIYCGVKSGIKEDGISINEEAVFVMTGGNIICTHDSEDDAAVVNYGIAYITGGTIEGANNAVLNQDGATMNILSGALITGKVSGTGITADSGVYTVATIGDAKYTSLDDAFTAATEGQTINLLADATPVLTSQRAITKAAVIDLGGKTLTLTEDDLYFGTTTFQNGTIVVDPSVVASTAVFWMFENQTLTFDNVDIVATGVTGTYLIGINGGTGSAVNLLNGSSITIDNTATAALTAVICDNGTGNTVTITDTEIDVTGVDGRFYLGGTNGDITVENSDIDLNGVKEGFYLRAGQTLNVTGNSNVDVTLNSTEGCYGINLTDFTSAYTKAETATVNATVGELKAAAQIGTTKYLTLQAAIDAAVDGDEIVLVTDVTGDVTITQKADVDVTIDGAGKTFTGVMTIDGANRYTGAETLTIKNVVFQAVDGKGECIAGAKNNAYAHNVTIEGCTFKGNDTYSSSNTFAVRFPSGAQAYGLTIKDCTVDEKMFGLLWVSYVGKGATLAEGLLVDNCTAVGVQEGITLTTTSDAKIINSTIDATGVVIRAGQEGQAVDGKDNNITLENNHLTSDGDVIVLRGDATDANLSMYRNAVSGTTHISGNTTATKLAIDANYWDGEPAPRVTDTPISVNSYYKDEARTDLVRNEMGSITPGYTTTDRIYGEAQGNAVTSFVVKVLNANNEVMGTATLKKPELINGNVFVSWYIRLNGESSGSWDVAWTAAPAIDNMPAKVQLFVDGARVSENSVQLNQSDDLNKINAAVLKEDSKTITAFYTTFEAAVAAGNNVAILTAGTYKVPTGKNLTITGAVDGVVFDNIGACNMGGANVTFNNVTFDYYPNVNYTGLQHSGNLVYNNCTINGQVFLYGQSETFNKCTFNQNSADAYNVWTYGAKEVAFNECTFNSAGKSVLVYTESANIFNDITVSNTTFNASQSVEGKAAIEMDSSLSGGINLTIDGETTATGFADGNVSGNGLWNNKRGNDNDANNDITVVVNNETVLQPIYTAKIGDKSYRTLQEAINAVKNGEEIVLVADCDEEVTFTQTKEVSFVLNGNDKTMAGNITITARAGKDAPSTLVIKNFNFKTDKTDYDFIYSVETNYYPNNITIQDCTFEGTSDINTDGYAVVAVRLKSANNITIKDCTGTGLHSFLQNTAGWNVTIDNVDITNSLSGFAMGTVQGTTIKNCAIEVLQSGIRLDGQYNNNAVIADNEIDAFIPVVVRKASVNGILTFNGTNEFTQTNTDGYWCVIGTAEYKANGELPTAATGKVSVTLAGDGLDPAGIYGSFGVASIDKGDGKVINYLSLAEALDAALDGETVNLHWTAGDAPISMEGTVCGKTVTITGTADVDWSKGWFYVGRNGTADGKVIFENANLNSVSNSSALGINVSGRKKGSTDTYNGTVEFKNSTVVLDYLIQKNVMTLDNSTLTVKNGCSLTGRLANETESGELATSTTTLNNGSKLVVIGQNGMNLGYEGYGVLNIDETSTFEATQDYGVAANGTMNIAGKASVAGTLTNNGAINLTAKDATLATPTADLTVNTDVADYKVAYIENVYKLVEKDYIAQVGGQKFEVFTEALDAVENDGIITLLGGAFDESGKEIDFTKDITFTITGTAPDAKLPIVTFQNATVNIVNAKFQTPELDARQNATINVDNSTIVDAGGNSIVKSYYNGKINITNNSTVYAMQVTTMGYIYVDESSTLNATWQTNVYGNGMITVSDGATFNTAALHLTAQDYSSRDNTDAERVGKPATIVVDGANLTIGKVLSAGDADYSYNSSEGINVGTVDGKSAILDIKNGANVNIYMANGETANIGAGGTVNVDASTLNVACRAADGTATLANAGTVYVTGASNLAAAKVTGNGWFYMNGVNLDADTKLDGAKVAFINGTNNVVGSTIKNGWFNVGIGQNAEAAKAAAFALANGITLGNVTVNVSENANIGGNGEAYSGWVGSAYSADKTQHTYALNVKNSLAAFGYMHVSKDGTFTVDGRSANDNKYTYDNANVNFYAGDFIINGVVTLNNADAWVKYTKMSVDHVGGVLNINGDTKYESSIHNGSNTGTSLVYYNSGEVNVAETAIVEIDNATNFVDGAVLNIAGNVTAKGAITGNGAINFTNDAATLTTATTGLTIGYNLNADKKVVYTEGAYKVAEKLYVAQIGDAKYESLQEAIENVADNGTVTLLSDVTVTEAAYGQNALNHARAINFTLDLNGKKLSADTGNSVFRFNIGGSGATSDVTVTVKNGTVVSGANTWCTLMASGASADAKAVMNLEDLTIENYKGGDFAVKAWANGEVNARNVVINASYGGGFYALGGEIVLDDCTVEQKGLWTAPYNSMTIGVSNGGKMTVNSGTYSALPVAAADGNNQGTSHGSWCGGVMSSGGTLVINGGNFSNGNIGGTASSPRELFIVGADADYGDNVRGYVEINGGTFSSIGALIHCETIWGSETDPANTYMPTMGVTIKGGDFTKVAGKIIGGCDPISTGNPVEVAISGGLYAHATHALDNSYLADGYVIAVVDELTDTVVEATVKVNDTYYATLEAGLKALSDGATLTFVKDITVTEAWDCRYNGAKVAAANVTIDGNGKTLKLTGEVKDNNWNTVFRFEGDNATVKNLTIDASEAASIQRGITSKLSITVDNCTFIGNGTTTKRAIIFGEGAGTSISNVVATVTNSTFKNWSYGVSDNQNTQDAKSVTITGNTFENASVLVSASENVTFDKNTLVGGYVNITSYTNKAGLSVHATENTLDAEQVNEITVNPSGIYAQGGFSIPVAEVGGAYYLTLASAISKANGATVTVLDDIILSEAVEVKETAAVLNLNGNSITPAAGATMTGGPIRLLDGADLTINGEGEISNNGNENVYAAVSVLGNNVKLTVNGGKLIGYYYGIAGNGYKTGTEVTINGGVITSGASDGLGIYHPQAGTLTVIDGEITGATGIYFKGGKLDIQGGTIKGTGASVDYEYNGSGCVATGDALVIENAEANGYAAIDGVSITGGTFHSENAAPVASYAPEASDALVEFIGEGCNAQFNNNNIDESLLAIGYQLTTEKNADGYYGVYLSNRRESMTIVDGAYTKFENKSALTIETLTYERTLESLNWLALYVPFEIPVSALTGAGYQVAYLNDVHSYDNWIGSKNENNPGQDGVIDDMTVESVILRAGTLRANHPYIIRATSEAAKEMKLVLNDVRLHTTDTQTKVECSSAYMNYTIGGTYVTAGKNELTGDATGNTPCYYISTSTSNWRALSATGSIKPFRLYLSMTQKNGSPVIIDEESIQQIRMRVIGESDGETTDIEYYDVVDETVDYIYDLQGRRVLEPQKGGLYIVNGKKVIF